MPNDPEQFPIPKSEIQTFSAGFWGFWILDRYVAILYVRPPTPILERYVADLYVQILDVGFRILDFGFGILDFEKQNWILHKRRILCTPTRVGGLYEHLYTHI